MEDTVELLLGTLTTDAPVQRVVMGAFWTAVVLDTSPPRCGLASTLRSAAHPAGPPVSRAGQLLDYRARELANLLRSSNVTEASIGMAAFNAMLDVDTKNCVELNARDLILERGRGKNVAIVGHFPFVEQVQQEVASCWVLEQHPQPGDLGAERAPDILPQADVVALTGTSLINHTFDELIDLCRRDAFIVLLGASAPLTTALFARQIDAISGTRVIDVPALLQAVEQGATFRQIPGKQLLTIIPEK